MSYTQSDLLPNLSNLTVSVDDKVQKVDRDQTPSNPSGPSGPSGPPVGTLTARLLDYPRHSPGSTWSKPEPRDISSMSFLEVVDYFHSAVYPEDTREMDDLTNFKHWEATRLLKPQDLCYELEETTTRYANAEAGAGGYYKRTNLEDKEIYVLGDSHGSMHSLTEILMELKDNGAFQPNGKLDPNTAIVSLGDILDRSPYTLECLYLVLRLQRENPSQVFITLGNHEAGASYQWEKSNGSFYEMKNEHCNDCGNDKKMDATLANMFAKMPLGIIAKTPLGIIQFSHGGVESVPVDKLAAFVDFVNFRSELDTMSVFGDLSGNRLQWADVVTSVKNPRYEAGGRPQLTADDMKAYLQATGIRMLLRGHSDTANLSLLFSDGSQPSERLQKENAIEYDRDLTWKLNGFSYSDKRKPDTIKPANSFVMDLVDFTMEAGYNLYTLQTASGSKAFDKTLISQEEPTTDLIAVTISSCPFSKPMPPVQMMSAFLVIEQPVRNQALRGL